MPAERKPARPAPATPGGDFRLHLILLLFYLALLALPFFMTHRPRSDQRVTIGPVALPSTCPSWLLFERKCPGCGLTRSWVQLTHGRLWASLRQHRLGPLMYLFFIYLALGQADALRRRPGRPPGWLARLDAVFPRLVILLLVLNWLADLLGGA